MNRIDLRPFGIDHILTPQTKLSKLNVQMIEHTATVSNLIGEPKEFNMKSGSYKIVELLGSGTYGTTYKVEGPDGKQYAIKTTRVNRSDILNFIKECLIQIILAEESKTLRYGPYVPTVYEMGYNSIREKAFLRTELMTNTAQTVIHRSSEKVNDMLVPNLIKQISKILKFFSDNLAFNHRDLKPDNIMFKMEDGKSWFKLIDFGFSCLTWNGLKINGTSYFSQRKSCFRTDRDLSQLLYAIARFHSDTISNKLYDRIAHILIANVGDKNTCAMVDGCNRLHEWRNTYNFMNRKNVKVPTATPNAVRHEMDLFLAGKPFKGQPQAQPAQQAPLDSKPPCQPGKVRDPVTRRCKKQEEHKPCKDGKVRDPVTRRCKNKIDEPCKDGKVRDPVTRRCKKPNVQKPCKEGKVRDPVTRRCKKPKA